MIGAVVFAFVCVVAVSAESGSRGFGDSIAWTNDLEEAKKVTDKPIFVLIHKTWCGACKALKGTFAGSNAIATASKEFVMVNLEDDEEPVAEEYKPDGGYIPRIFFLKDGKVDASIVNAGGNPKYKYYYSSEDQILQSMKIAKEKFASSKNEL